MYVNVCVRMSVNVCECLMRKEEAVRTGSSAAQSLFAMYPLVEKQPCFKQSLQSLRIYLGRVVGVCATVHV